jgi:hypothetical protein
MEIIAVVISLIALIVFFVLASNVASLKRTSRSIDNRLEGIQLSLERMVRNQEGHSGPVSLDDKAKAYDAMEAAKRS